ncbi:MAG: ABC transporter ATP-binding protein [Bacilli bacterium]|jgi:ATP-binding cassette subfamily B protein|nr:ABC transporter ATP-binding protein [Bacilli bacterium]
MAKKRMGPPGASVEKAKDFKGTLKKLIRYVGIYKIGITIVFFVAIASTIFSIAGPKILGNATQELYTGLIAKITGTGSINFSAISKILLFLLGLYILSALFSYIESWVMSGISKRTTYRLRKEISEKIKKLPMRYFDAKTTGETLSVITNDVDTLQQSLNESATELVTSIVTVIGIFIMMCTINVSLAILTALVLPIASIFVMAVMKRSQKYFQNQQKYLATVDGEVEEMLGGHTVVKAFNAEDKLLNEFEKENEKLYEAGWKSQFLSGLMHPIMNFIGNLNYAIIAIVGAYFCAKGRITVGNIQSFVQYSKNFTQPIARLAQVMNQIQSMLAASERVFEFLEEPEEEDKGTLQVPLESIKGNIEFKHVRFGYTKDKVIIKDFNAVVKSGQKIAIVGPTGAGKTTMIKLLMRFYTVRQGEILIDGHNINEFKRSDLRNIFGMVLQDTWLFSGSIMENLRYGKLDATDDEVIEAAKTAHVHHFIQTLPEAYNMILNEETNNVSGGQKQLLTIARAILANPKVMILDEATSNVDTRTEILIQKAMDELMKGRTSFIIAHRLSTIKNADLILVMKEGDIVEVGNHDELIKKNGFYADLYNSQFEEVE